MAHKQPDLFLYRSIVSGKGAFDLSAGMFIITGIIILLVILIVAGVKAGAGANLENGGEEVIKSVYTYLVLFATLMMIIGGSVGAFMAIADIIAPAPYYQSFEEYKRWGAEERPYPERPSPGNGAGEVSEERKLTEAELKEKYDAMVLAQKEMETQRAKNTLIKSFGWIVVPLPVFIYFQRRFTKKE